MTIRAMSQIRQPMNLGLRRPSRRPYRLSMSPPAGVINPRVPAVAGIIHRRPGSERERHFTDGRQRRQPMLRIRPSQALLARLAVAAAAVAAVAVLVIALSAVHLLPQLRNPFAEKTTVTSQPVLLKSITALSRYEAASGSFQVVVDLSQHSLLPSFLQGSETLFIGQGTDIAFVNFGQLKGQAIRVSANRSAVTVTLPHAQLEPAVLNVRQSYVYARQQGLLNRIGDFFGGDPNGQQQVYIAAQQRISAAARHSPLLAEAERNTRGMLTGMLSSLGFKRITVSFGSPAPAGR
jgi:hypothetical protein